MQLISETHKKIVMLKARESVKNSLFYLGEALATECMVSFENIKGYALILGDFFEKSGRNCCT
ncbi:MAG: phosphonate C-P lyase system protein PhnG [Oscillospiraceae bacterium]